MRLQLLAYSLALFSAAGCGSSSKQGAPGEEARSAKARVTTPDVPAADLAELVAGNNQFAFDAFQALRGAVGGNLFFSPYSISSALAMTYAGARNATATQMASALHFTLPEARFHPAFDALDLALASRGQGAKGKDGGAFRLRVSNALWGLTGYHFLGDFLDTLAQYYDAGLHLLDFVTSPEPSRIAINDWVSSETEGRITDLLPQGSITPDTRLVLTNAVYFNAAWQNVFDATATQDGSFQGASATTTVAMMAQFLEEASYAEGDDYQALELPYDGAELSMVVILPKIVNCGAGANCGPGIEERLDADVAAAIVAAMQPRAVDLTLPRWKVDGATLDLAAILSGLGMLDVFVPGTADLSGMDGTRELFISAILHQAFIDVDEAGTEAAAATAVVVGTASAPVNIAEMHVDHPFIYFIRDIETGSILFLGRVTDL